MFVFNTYIFVNILRFCERRHLFPLFLVSKRINRLTWIHLIHFLRIDLNKIFIKNCSKIETVRFLLRDSRVDPSAEDNYAIKWSSENGHTEIVKLLLESSKINNETKDFYRRKHNI